HRARRLEGVGRADRARARAALVHVAHPGRRAAHRPGVPRRVLAVVAAAVALVAAARVAVAGARRPRRTLGVRRTAGAVPRAVLRRIALTRRGAAHDARSLQGAGRPDRARARPSPAPAPFRSRRAAHRPGVPRRVLAVVAAAVALVAAARVAVAGARRPRRTLGVRRTAGAVPRAVLRRIALTRRG